jgi:hypothetical protein
MPALLKLETPGYLSQTGTGACRIGERGIQYIYLGKSSFQGRTKLTLIQFAQTRVCMPPGPLYNWLAVAHSALVILDHALQYRAAQVTRVGSIRVSPSRQRGARSDVYEKTQEDAKDVEEIVPSTTEPPMHASDINISRSNAPPPILPEPDAPANDVCLIYRRNFLYILKHVLL